MSHFESIGDYERYVASRSYEQLLDIAAHMDKEKSPERYGLVRKHLSSNIKTLSENKTLCDNAEGDLFLEVPFRHLTAGFIGLVLSIILISLGVDPGKALLWMNAFMVALIFALPLFLIQHVDYKEAIPYIKVAVLLGAVLMPPGYIIEAFISGKQEAIDALLLRKSERLIYFSYMCFAFAAYMAAGYLLRKPVVKN